MIYLLQMSQVKTIIMSKSKKYLLLGAGLLCLLHTQTAFASPQQSFNEGQYDKAFREAYAKALEGDAVANRIVGIIFTLQCLFHF